MNASLQKRCELFIKNRDTAKSVFKWSSSYIYPVCSAVFTEKGISADEEKLKYCKKLLKEKTGVFSNFRQIASPAIASILAAEPSPDSFLDRALTIYKDLKKYFFTSAYLPMAAIMIAGTEYSYKSAEISEKVRRVYDLMKNEHPFLTSGEDCVYAALLSVSGREEREITNDAEECYMRLKDEFFSKNAVQSLSHVLALCSGSPEEKCENTLGLLNSLKENGLKYGKDYELATLGVLANLPGDRNEIIADIKDADRFLSEQKGYGIFGLSKKQRLMHAGMTVSAERAGNSDAMQAAATAGTLSLIAAMQAALYASIAASSAVASASSSQN